MRRFTTIILITLALSCHSRKEIIMKRLGNGIDTLVQEPSTVDAKIWSASTDDLLTFKQFIKDKKGRIYQERVIDQKGNLIRVLYTPTVTEYLYDDNDNLIATVYRDHNNKISPNPDGIAVQKNKYDQRSNLIRQEYYNANQKYFPTEAGTVAVEYDYDPKNRKIETRYFDPTGNLKSKAGKVKFMYDTQDKLVREEIYDYVNSSEKLFYFIEYEYQKDATIERRIRANGDTIKVLQTTKEAIFEILEQTDSTIRKRLVEKL